MKSLILFQKISIKGAVWLLMLGHVACGNQKIEVTPGDTPVSEINLNSPEDQDIESEEAKSFFIDNLWTIMREPDTKGCTGSGCHALEEDEPQTFFRVDADDVENSWNWAKVRRFERVASDYADLNSSALISGRATSNHFNFSNWSESEKNLITEWIAIP